MTELEAGAEAQADAIQRLEAALIDQARTSEENHAAKGSPWDLSAAVDLSAANEQVAARRAWLHYIEHGQ